MKFPKSAIWPSSPKQWKFLEKNTFGACRPTVFATACCLGVRPSVSHFRFLPGMASPDVCVITSRVKNEVIVSSLKLSVDKVFDFHGIIL